MAVCTPWVGFLVGRCMAPSPNKGTESLSSFCLLSPGIGASEGHPPGAPVGVPPWAHGAGGAVAVADPRGEGAARVVAREVRARDGARRQGSGEGRRPRWPGRRREDPPDGTPTHAPSLPPSLATGVEPFLPLSSNCGVFLPVYRWASMVETRRKGNGLTQTRRRDNGFEVYFRISNHPPP